MITKSNIRQFLQKQVPKHMEWTGNPFHKVNYYFFMKKMFQFFNQSTKPIQIAQDSKYTFSKILKKVLKQLFDSSIREEQLKKLSSKKGFTGFRVKGNLIQELQNQRQSINQKRDNENLKKKIIIKAPIEVSQPEEKQVSLELYNQEQLMIKAEFAVEQENLIRYQPLVVEKEIMQKQMEERRQENARLKAQLLQEKQCRVQIQNLNERMREQNRQLREQLDKVKQQ